MESSRLSFKLFVQEPTDLDVKTLVPVFHSWIQNHAITDHLLIDVANYSHVHNGPGIVLVAHEANYSIDHRGGRLGLTYQRKQPIPETSSFADRLRAALSATRQAAKLLEDHGLTFRNDEIEFRICDRLLAPNNSETFGAVKADLLDLFPDAQLEHHADPHELFEVLIRTAMPS
jgi:hypothetical protein